LEKGSVSTLGTAPFKHELLTEQHGRERRNPLARDTIKFMTKRSTKTALNTKKFSTVLPLTKDAAKAEFKRRMRHTDDGSGDNELARFLRVMDAVQEIYPSGFTINEIFALSQSVQLEAKTILELWEHWRTTMIALNKIQPIATCLDAQMFATIR
jgi:hypothetical protein